MACTDMVFSENDDFFKHCENIKKKHAHNVHHSCRARGAVLSLQSSLSSTKNVNVKVAIELFIHFQTYRNLDSGNFSLKYS